MNLGFLSRSLPCGTNRMESAGEKKRRKSASRTTRRWEDEERGKGDATEGVFTLYVKAAVRTQRERGARTIDTE